MATNIKSYVSQKKKSKFDSLKTFKQFNLSGTFTLADWKDLCCILDIMPHGLNKIELRYLRTLHREGTVRLYNLAAKLQMTRAAIQSDAEIYLQKLNFIEVSSHGRGLSNDAKLMFEKNPHLLEKHKSS